MHIRQNINIIAMLLLVALTISCSDDEEVVQEDQLIGTWSIASQEIQNIQLTVLVAGTPISTPIDEFLPQEQREILDTLDILPEDAILTFEEDRTYTGSSASAGSTVLAGSWTFSQEGEQLTLTGLEQAQQLLGTSSLTFEVQDFTTSNLSLVASVSDISLDQFNIAELEGATVSGEYRIDLRK